jgi:hypothetical protein
MRIALEAQRVHRLRVALEELAEVREDGVVAFDLDGTLAEHDGWKGYEHIGAPVAKMVERWKAYRAKGATCVIFTARASAEEADRPVAIKTIEDWAQEHLGEVPPITHEKTMHIVRMYDDRARQVLENTGEVVGETA